MKNKNSKKGLGKLLCPFLRRYALTVSARCAEICPRETLFRHTVPDGSFLASLADKGRKPRERLRRQGPTALARFAGPRTARTGVVDVLPPLSPQDLGCRVSAMEDKRNAAATSRFAAEQTSDVSACNKKLGERTRGQRDSFAKRGVANNRNAEEQCNHMPGAGTMPALSRRQPPCA